MKRYIVTGASGFIGFHLTDYLSKLGAEVTAIDNFARGKMDAEFEMVMKRNNITFINADLTEKTFYSKLKGKYDGIFHLAAINGTKNFYKKPYEVFRANILTLLNMLEWCNPNNCSAFLFTSSSETYAGTINCFLSEHNDYIPTKENIPLTIDNVLNPRWSYGGSKIAGEILTANYCRSRKIPFKIIRYHNIYGPRMGFDHVLPEFIRRIYHHENPFDIYGGEETRAFCDVIDGVKATDAVMCSEKCNGEIVHIGNSTEEIKIIDLLHLLFDISGFHPKIRLNAVPEGCVVRRCPDTQKLFNLTGFRAEISLEEGLNRIYEWYMKVYDEENCKN